MFFMYNAGAAGAGSPGAPNPMRPRTLSILLAALLIAALPLRSRAQLPFQSVETRNMRVVYYDPEHAYIIPHLVRCFENSAAFYYDLLGYRPYEHVTILLQDFDDYGYAGTSTIPNNYLTLGIEPFEYVYETCPTNERFNWVINHELFHVVASEKASHIDRVWRGIFQGKVLAESDNPESMIYSYLTSPRRFAPRWYHEGIAVFMETWLAGGIGRSLAGYDEMTFRAMVRDGAYFYDVVGLESEGTSSDFQIGQNSYLYGTRFMSHLALKYGPEKVLAWVNRTDDSKAYYAGQFKRVFGVGLDDEWKAWIDFEHDWQNRNLATIRQYPVTAERTIFDKALGSVSRAFIDHQKNRLLVAVNYPGEFAHVAAIDLATGEIEKIHNVQTPALYYVTSLAFDEASRKLFYTTNNGKHWRDLNALDVDTKESTRLITDCRIGDLAYSPADSILWGVQHHNGISTLVRISPPYNAWQCILPIMDFRYGTDIFDVDVSPDGKTLTSGMLEISGAVKLVSYETEDLLKGNAGYRVLYEFDKTGPANFVFAPDGQHLYGTSYQTGVSNVFRWDFANEKMECVTNAEVGYFRPIPNGDSLVVFSYSAKGFRPVMVADTTLEDVNAVRYLGQEVWVQHPMVESLKLGSPREVDLDSVVTYRGPYHKFGSVTTSSLYPITEQYKVYPSVGLRWNLMDPLGLHGGDIKLGVSPSSDLPDDERVHAEATYRHFPYTFRTVYNPADFYDYFGPTKTSRKGYAFMAQRHDYLISDRPRSLEYTIDLAYYGGLQQLPYNQNVLATFDSYTALTGSLDYKRTQSSIGAVDAEKGIRWSLALDLNLVNSDFYTKGTGELDLGFLTPLDHSSIWLRGAAGYSRGDREDSFASFYFGGFGNNYVDHREVKRYRNYDRFPGAEIDQVDGTNFTRLMAEWTLPPLRFRRVGFQQLYCTYARTALFATGIITNLDNTDFRREAGNVGGQVDFRLVIFSALESTLSVGYAAFKEDGHAMDTEFMISLKIM
jgi:hypothetical protein